VYVAWEAYCGDTQGGMGVSWVRETAVGSGSPTRPADVALRLGVPAVLLALASVGWWWSVRMSSDMHGSGGAMAPMDSMSGDVLSLGGFLVAWLAMMSAMMFPAISPVVRLYARAAAAGRVAPLPAFVAGYIAVWTALGLPGYLGWRVLMDPIAEGRAWAGRLAGVVLLVAAVWQLTPLKSVCLRHCRSPMSFFLRFGRSVTRPVGALRMGARHGLYCLGCCWALMAVLVAVGTMSVAWMAGLALLILLEKNAPHGERIAVAAAVVFATLGAVLVVHPSILTAVT
jgi:predicted metal-binding membrane protein